MTSPDAHHSESHPVLLDVPGMELIAPLINDPSVSDILINGTESVFIERAGKLERTEITFASEEAVQSLGIAIARFTGRKVDPSRPMVDARLPDGSRVNIVMPPLTLDGTTISIRKFATKSFTLDAIAQAGSISPQLAEFLKLCGRCRLNILISGGTGSGKTTLLNAISQHIDETERVVTIEDAAELKLQKKHVVRMETRPKQNGVDEPVTTRDLVRNALRMRPDRILVGEVRGEEAFDMMQAMNTGHEGSLTTIHANHPRDALFRLENMIALAGLHMPTQAVRAQIASALHLIVQVSRMRDGRRRVTYVSEVVGMEGGVITMHDLIQFVSTGEGADGVIKGEWRWMGLVPRFARRIAYWGELDHFAKIFGINMLKL